MSGVESGPTLTVEAVRDLLLLAVKDKGEDYRYERVQLPNVTEGIKSCVYFNEGAPSCIVGHVLHYMAVGESALVRNNTIVSALNPDLFGNDRRIIAGLAAAQFAQDDGKTWGEALAAFDEAVQP